MSISPGVTTRPDASNASAPFGFLMAPSIFATAPSSINKSKTPSRPWLGSITRPPWMRSFAILNRLLVHPGQQIKHRHPHRHPVRDLLEDHRVGTVGQLAGD